MITDAGFGPGYKVPGPAAPHRPRHRPRRPRVDELREGQHDADAPGMCFSDEPTIAISGEFGIGSRTACTSPRTARTSSRSRAWRSTSRSPRDTVDACRPPASRHVAEHLGIELSEYDERMGTFIPHYEEMLDAAAAAVSPHARRIVELGVGTRALPRACSGGRGAPS